MKALSIRQPWAWLIVNGYKDIENRTWPTQFRGRVMIHAGQAVDGQVLALWRVDSVLNTVPMPSISHLTTGAIIGEVYITGCVTESTSPWFCGPYGFVIANPQAYEVPIPYKGKLGFFEVAP